MGGDGKFMGQGPFDTTHYVKAAFGGAVCCSVTHGGTTPIDVIKTRMQLEPARYTSFVGTAKSIVSTEGSGALFTGVMPTFQGYFVQGWFKFGGVEIMKTRLAMSMSEQDAWKNRDAITLGGSAVAEFVADVFLCPYEACRIRAVSDPGYANGMMAVGRKLVSEMGVLNGLYSGFGPMLLKQIPYTMAKFAVQQKCAERIYQTLGSSPSEMSKSGVLTVSLGSGVVAGVAAATISQPADGLLSKVNKKGAGGEGSMMVRLGRIAAETGLVKLCTQGLFARWLHVGLITAGQFAVVDACMMAVGAQRFHFHDPAKH
eukprot:TRINITY_DN2222_c0_g1_i3.p1 TRINITY_DN2222_c0_g1~~TRINITY_DN2222_c0_g1_i3.p1  ORF type:complete len:315 (-),score=53.67 TRINITY_DN2222_c0_g1_i3:155-1099(-)